MQYAGRPQGSPLPYTDARYPHIRVLGQQVLGGSVFGGWLVGT
jgi:hypothetical protein